MLFYNNPLCQTIFDARLRSFSDYSQSFEPLGYHSVADRIITSLQESADEEQRIAIFFDYFTHYRPFPGSQRYIVDIDLADKVLNALTTYCQERIAAINTREDYLTTKQLIKQIQHCGGNQFLFDTIKYDVASAIEAEDMCSMRTYADHMNAIAEVLKKPQTSLADFSESLKNSTGYQQMITTHMQGNTLLMSASPSTGPSPETQLSLVVQP